jgi:hypothetical protein
MRKIEASDFEGTLGYAFAAAILIPLLIGPLLGKDMAAIVNAAVLSSSGSKSAVDTQSFHSMSLRDFLIPAASTITSDIAPSQPAAAYPGQVNDGIALLRRHVNTQDRILALDFSNPFPFALNLPPARGGSTSWLLDASFNRSVHVADQDVFGDASFVMIPRYERNASTVSALKEIYGAYLRRNFRLVDRSDDWELYQRSAPGLRERNASALSRSASPTKEN